MAETFNTHLENPRNATEREIADLGPWFHNLHLPDGHQTAPAHRLGDFPSHQWACIAPHLPDIDGWSVLDIGCNAGFYTFELARRGARVTAIDMEPHYLRQAKWAAEKFGLQDRITFRQMQVYDLASMEETFDLVWFMGVLYHLRYPLLALDIVTRKTKRLLMLQTLTMPGDEVIQAPENLPIKDRTKMLEKGWPQMAFIERQLEGDATNWWAPNHACVEAMIRSCGFAIRTRPGEQLYLCDPREMPAAAQEDEYRSAVGRIP